MTNIIVVGMDSNGGTNVSGADGGCNSDNDNNHSENLIVLESRKG